MLVILKRIEIAAFLAFSAVIAFSLITFEGDCESVRESCFRLHIIANSNTDEDQSLKLLVRDSVLQNTKDIFNSAQNKDEAVLLCKENISEIEKISNSVIKENGYDYKIKIEVGKSFFPTRTYENYTLPAGKYDALRIIIGNGEGKNWWCVMFPSLCLPAAKKKNSLSDVLTKDEIALIESNPKYEIRFWIIEKIESLKSNKKECLS